MKANTSAIAGELVIRSAVRLIALIIFIAAAQARVFGSVETTSGSGTCSPQLIVLLKVGRPTGFPQPSNVTLFCGSPPKQQWTSDSVPHAATASAVGSTIYIATAEQSYYSEKPAYVALLSRIDGSVVKELHPECASYIAVAPTRRLVYADMFAKCTPNSEHRLTIVTPPEQEVVSKNLITEWPPVRFVFDRDNQLYILQNPYEIEAFDSTFRLLRQYPGGYNIIDPQDVAFTPQNGMLIANSRTDFCSQGKIVTGFVSAFKPNSTDLVARFGIGGCPTSIAIFNSEVYVADGLNSRIMVYSLPKFKLVRRITSGIELPKKIRFDRQGRLYVLNVPRLFARTGNANISIYERGQSLPSTVLPFGNSDPFDMIVD